MLVHLHIRDVAIIEELELGLGSGLTVLTGETGAGKSIIVGAAALLRGGRARAELIRTGSDEAVVEAVFDLTGRHAVLRRVEEAGLPLSGGTELLVRRVVPRSGRGRVYVNGSLCTVGVLARITGQLLEISSQHEHQQLTDRSTHLEILDATLQGDGPDALAEMARAHEALRRAVDRLDKSRLDDRQRAERLEFLRFQLGELEAAAIRPGEDLELERERARLARAAELIEAASAGERELYSGEGAAADRLAVVARRLDELAAADSALDPLSRQLQEAHALVEDVAFTLGRYGATVETDPARLVEVEERLDLLQRLWRKHGGTLDEVLERQRGMQAELADLEQLEQSRDALEERVARARAAAGEVAGRLTRARREAATRLGRTVTRELSRLRMRSAKISVEVGPRAPRADDDPGLCFGERRVGPSGWDRVELMFAANRGEQARPLINVASGGELSRVMLALRKCVGLGDPVPSSIYDEVDAGIGGAVADVVGRSLAEVSRHRQVICVTHLPQVAAHAETHFTVGKRTARRRTSVTVRRLEGKARVEELARMLGGEEVTSQARANARQLLRAAAS
jgi:DNA repair protein RecN (Recombination protein N)